MTNQEAGAALPIVQTLRVAPFPAAREAADAIGKLADALSAFLNVRDQMPETHKLIIKGLDGFTPIRVTVTKDQFLAARALLAKLEAGDTK